MSLGVPRTLPTIRRERSLVTFSASSPVFTRKKEPKRFVFEERVVSSLEEEARNHLRWAEMSRTDDGSPQRLTKSDVF